MRLIKQFCVTLFLFFLLKPAQTQENYPFVFDKNPQVTASLEQWKDLKFGLLMHWGPYSQWGVVESWSICPEDEGWTQRTRGPYQNYFEYRKAYENLSRTFNPVQFNPEKWAAAAKGAGFKYMVFTTKHHDGFCMFDTKETEYKITGKETPFSTHPRANVTKEIFNAFRNEGILAGAYFSKPDWHNENFWWPYFPPKDRNINYDLNKYPERWKAFSDFTYRQIEELMTGYGKIDILWLDGAWVMPDSLVNRKIDWQKGIPAGQDINMHRIGTMARKHQPGILVVDRWVPTIWENYHTPEQAIPDNPLPYPWETCMTMAGSWSYAPNDVYKPTATIIQNLVNIVCNDGNYLLNVAPGPDGEWHTEAYGRMKEIGRWMNINGEGIYNTRAYRQNGKIISLTTEAKDKRSIYVFRLLKEDKGHTVVSIPVPTGKKIKKVTLLGGKEKAEWVIKNGSVYITTATKIPEGHPGYALCYKVVFN